MMVEALFAFLYLMMSDALVALFIVVKLSEWIENPSCRSAVHLSMNLSALSDNSSWLIVVWIIHFVMLLIIVSMGVAFVASYPSWSAASLDETLQLRVGFIVGEGFCLQLRVGFVVFLFFDSWASLTIETGCLIWQISGGINLLCTMPFLGLDRSRGLE